MKKLFAGRKLTLDIDVILLLIRIAGGYAFVIHGWGKIQNPFTWAYSRVWRQIL